jgi:hypothetical protein
MIKIRKNKKIFVSSKGGKLDGDRSISLTDYDSEKE